MNCTISRMIIILALIALTGCGRHILQPCNYEPAVGDLLFQDVDCGPMCDAIETVTTGYNGADFSHVGISARGEKGEPVVIEAVSAGVVITDLNRFLERSLDERGQPKVIVGRLKLSHRHLAEKAVREALALKGKPYDKAFVIGNETYYCSELVYEAFRRANNDIAVFTLEPMTFKAQNNGEILPVWRDYFAKLRIDVPQGEPGINPGGISRSEILDIVYFYSQSICRK